MQGNTDERPSTENDLEAKENLLGFFRILLEADIELHPELYKKTG